MATSPGDVDDHRLLTEIQAADFLRLSSRTLQAWRCQRVGPPFVRVGRAVRYQRSALVSWTAENTVAPQRQPPAARDCSDLGCSPSKNQRLPPAP